MAHAGGRPTKYKPEYAKMLIDYFNKDVVKEIKQVTSGTNGKGGEWSKEDIRYEALFFPTLELFANSINVDDNTLQTWASTKDADNRYKHPEFHSAYNRAKEIQKGALVQNAMTGKLNSNFAQFFAINMYGMQSKSVVESKEEVTHKYEELTDEQLEHIIQARKDRLSGTA